MRRVNIGFFKVNDIEIGGTITVNQSVQKQIFNHTKKNQGFGENGSDGTMLKVNGGVFDQDLIDKGLIAKSMANKRKGQ